MPSLKHGFTLLSEGIPIFNYDKNMVFNKENLGSFIDFLKALA